MDSGGTVDVPRLSSPSLPRPQLPAAVGWRTVLWLWWTARNDRRAGLPVGLSAATTPVLRDLVAQHDHACERERSSYITDDEPVATRLASIKAEIGPRRQRLMELTQLVRDIVRPLTPEQTEIRMHGEEELPLSLVRQRRREEHRRAGEVARAELSEAHGALASLHSEQASLEALRDRRAELARSRVLQVGDSTRQLASVYRWALVRRHPQREELIEQWDDDVCAAPEWADVTELTPSRRPMSGGQV